MMGGTLYHGEARAVLASLPPDSVHACVTSPPYFGLRDYGTPPQVWGGDPAHRHDWRRSGPSSKRQRNGAPGGLHAERSTDNLDHWVHPETGSLCACGAWRGELGTERDPDAYVAHVVEVMRAVRRVLRPDGTLWLNIGDSYVSNPATATGRDGFDSHRGSDAPTINKTHHGRFGGRPDGLKPKDLIGVPWMLAFALRADGWYLRQEIVWAKLSGLPESMKDRPTSATERVFLLSRSPRYFYDKYAALQLTRSRPQRRSKPATVGRGAYRQTGSTGPARDEPLIDADPAGVNARNWWVLPPDSLALPHYARFPKELARRCIRLGTSARGVCPSCLAPWARLVDAPTNRETVEPSVTLGWSPTCSCDAGDPVPSTVLDPFGGSGTTAHVARDLGRDFVSIDLADDSVSLSEIRLGLDAERVAT